MHSTGTTQGYILLYTILAATLFSVVATGLLMSTLRELQTSDQSIEAAKARWAAEAGIECIQYWDRIQNPSRLSTESAGTDPMYCLTESGSSVTFSKNAENTLECEPWGATDILINPIFTGSTACAEVSFRVDPLPHYPIVCKVQITSRGYNDCTTREVERIVWSDEL